ncbi:hypothetical protein [Plantibacter sp. lyk4-40-MEA-4]|uniref:hypothetical protein n=1 Tax=Plantibacter sp. lyk4-40-MEA-4 TaxID=3040298 RepID=UPI00254C81EF|nr:hypothetical protein [Plantibacter sp. lyk4-40-MEA-4]
MEYREIAGVVSADGVAAAGWIGQDRYRVGVDEWQYGGDGMLSTLHADVGPTRWMHATRTSDRTWRVATSSGSFELRWRTDIAPHLFELVGAVLFGRVEGVPGGALVVPPQMPVAEAVFVLWVANHLVRAAQAGAIAMTAAVNAVNAVNTANTVAMISRF